MPLVVVGVSPLLQKTVSCVKASQGCVGTRDDQVVYKIPTSECGLWCAQGFGCACMCTREREEYIVRPAFYLFFFPSCLISWGERQPLTQKDRTAVALLFLDCLLCASRALNSRQHLGQKQDHQGGNECYRSSSSYVPPIQNETPSACGGTPHDGEGGRRTLATPGKTGNKVRLLCLLSSGPQAGIFEGGFPGWLTHKRSTCISALCTYTMQVFLLIVPADDLNP